MKSCPFRSTPNEEVKCSSDCQLWVTDNGNPTCSILASAFKLDAILRLLTERR